ncbi:MAG: hypothetical protein ACOC3V_05255 [bacterium]
MASPVKNKQIIVTSDFDINNNKLINVSDPTNDNDAVNLQFYNTGIDSIESDISGLTSDLSSLEAEINTLSGITSDLTVFLFSGITSLETEINNEISDRLSGDTFLGTWLYDVSEELSTESSIRESVDESLSTEISTESSIRESVDESLSTEISNESSIRESTDETLSTEISNESSVRESVDESLSTEISNESSVRSSTDTLLSTAILSANSIRSSADTSLSTEINDKIDKFDNTEYEGNGDEIRLAKFNSSGGVDVQETAPWNSVLAYPPKYVYSTEYNLDLEDTDQILLIDNSSLVEITIPEDFLTGSGFTTSIFQYGTGTVRIIADSGVTILSANDENETRTRYSMVNVIKIDENLYILGGDLA